MPEAEHPDPDRWWKHRRRGYYAGMWAGALQTPIWIIIGLVDAKAIASMTAVIGWSYGICATLILAYFGNTTVETITTRGAR